MIRSFLYRQYMAAEALPTIVSINDIVAPLARVTVANNWIATSLLQVYSYCFVNSF